jgi:large subunit ribosomal protein L25
MNQFEINAEARNDAGKGASRRLRRLGKVPAIVYGGDRAPAMVAVDHNELVQHLQHEAFYSHVLALKAGAETEQVVLKDVQRHPYRPVIMHLDLQRVSASRELHMHVPLHFVNEDLCPGKKAGGLVSHHLIEAEVACLPQNLPEYIEVDLSGLHVGQAIHLSELRLPPGVSLVAHMPEHDQPVVSIHKGGGSMEEAYAAAAPAEPGAAPSA